MSNKKDLPKVPTLVAPEPSDIPVNKLNTAIILNGIVYQIVNYNQEFVDVLMKNPKFIVVNNLDVKKGYIYNENNGTFSPPS